MSQMADGALPRGGTPFRLAIVLFVAFGVAKVHEVFPPLAAIPIVKVVGGAVILAALTRLRLPDVRAFLSSPTARWGIALVALCFASAPFAIWRGNSVGFLVDQLWKLMVVFFMVGASGRDPRNLRAALVAYAGGAAIVGGRVLTGGGGMTVGRAFAGAAFDPNETALLMVTAIPIAAALIPRRGLAGRLMWIAATLILVAASVKTGSRGGLLGLMALGVWAIVHVRPQERLRAIVGVGAAISVFAATADRETLERFRTIGEVSSDYNVTTREGRLEVWKRGLGYMARYPILGVGVDNFPIAEGTLSGKRNEGFGIKYGAAHNSFIQAGAELGVLGLLAFTSMLVAALAACYGVRRRINEAGVRGPGVEWLARTARGVSGALVGFTVTAFFLSFAFQMVTFFLLGVAVSVGTLDGQLSARRPYVSPERERRKRAGQRRLPVHPFPGPGT